MARLGLAWLDLDWRTGMASLDGLDWQDWAGLACWTWAGEPGPGLASLDWLTIWAPMAAGVTKVLLLLY